MAGEITGRPIRRVVVDDDEYVAGMVAGRAPRPMAEMMLGMFAASRLGDFAPADPALAELVGRPATSLREFLTTALSPAR